LLGLRLAQDCTQAGGPRSCLPAPREQSDEYLASRSH